MNNKQYAISGLLATAVFWLTYFTMASQRPEYSFLTKAISELGSVGAPNQWIWNLLGYIVPGILISIFSFGLYKNIAPERSSKLPLIGFFFSGLLMAFSGIFPGDFENKRSLTMLLHTIGSFGSYMFFLIGAFSYPKQMQKTPYWADAAKPSLTFVWLTILFGTWPFFFPSFPAVGQRFVFAFYFCWILFHAFKLIRQPKT